MKILVVFIDMIRVNRLKLVNENIVNETPLDRSLKKLGGTFYTNSFTEGPDTPRAMATFATGKSPYKNGCNTRLKWPRDFLKEDLKTVYDIFLEKNYKMTFFSNPNERECGMYSEKITNLDIHNEDYELDNYLKSLTLEKNHFIFISLPDFHWSLDDNGYNHFGEKKAFDNASKSFDLIFNNLNKDDFDHIFLFSDHGFKFNYEYRSQPKYMLLNEDRLNILMFHRKKGDEESIKINNKLCALSDLYYTFDEIINDIKSDQSLFSEKEKKYIVVEDHLNFEISVNLTVGIWALVTKDKIYVRDANNGYLISKNNETDFGIVNEYDETLKKESTFGIFFKEHQKVNNYKKLILKQTKYMHGGERKKIAKLLRLYHNLKF